MARVEYGYGSVKMVSPKPWARMKCADYFLQYYCAFWDQPGIDTYLERIKLTVSHNSKNVYREIILKCIYNL